MSYRHPWLGVEVRHLATLVAVARTRSFRQAAGELGYVQSAVGQQISTLETVVGARLVERRRGQRTVTLTPAGERLLDRSVGIVAQLRAARVDIAAFDERSGPTIRLAVSSDVAADVVTCILRAATDALPRLCLRVTSAKGDELVSGLERGTADIAVGARDAHPAFATATLVDDPFVLLVRPDSPLADAHLRAAGLRLDRALRVPQASAVPALVSAVVTRRDLLPSDDGLLVFELADAPPRVLGLAWHLENDACPSTQALSRAARAVFAGAQR